MHPQRMRQQSLNFMQLTHPITFSTPGTSSISSWSSILAPSPQTGALDSMSSIRQPSPFSHLGHLMLPISMSPLQKVAFNCFLQVRHCSLSLTLMGESSVWMYLLVGISSITSMGLPSATLRVQKMRGGVQLTTECPSGLVMRISSLVFLMKASLSMRVQQSLDEAVLSVPLMMMLSASKVICVMVECFLSYPSEKRAVLLIFMKLFPSRTDELDSISMLLLRHHCDSLIFSSLLAMFLLMYRELSGCSGSGCL